MVLGPGEAPDISRCVPVVVGAHLRAEISDRAVAYELAERVSGAFARTGSSLAAVVCTDLWYLNDDRLRQRPTISIGEPEVSALSAYLADKLPHAYAVSETLLVQMDLPAGEALVNLWGRGPEETRVAARVFWERYLDHFTECALRQPA